MIFTVSGFQENHQLKRTAWMEPQVTVALQVKVIQYMLCSNLCVT
jgi:hypothetical protein